MARVPGKKKHQLRQPKCPGCGSRAPKEGVVNGYAVCGGCVQYARRLLERHAG